MSRHAAVNRPKVRRNTTRSITLTLKLRAEIARYARRHHLSFGAAVRDLVARELRVQKSLERVRRAWEIEQAWAEVEAMERGESPEVSRHEIDAASRESRARIRKSKRADG